MGTEGYISKNTPRQERISLSEMSVVESNKLQSELACFVYDEEHQGEDVENVSEGMKMLWWIQNGYARAYGDLEEVELGDLERLAEKIRGKVAYR